MNEDDIKRALAEGRLTPEQKERIFDEVYQTVSPPFWRAYLNKIQQWSWLDRALVASVLLFMCYVSIAAVLKGRTHPHEATWAVKGQLTNKQPAYTLQLLCTQGACHRGDRLMLRLHGLSGEAYCVAWLLPQEVKADQDEIVVLNPSMEAASQRITAGASSSVEIPFAVQLNERIPLGKHRLLFIVSQNPVPLTLLSSSAETIERTAGVLAFQEMEFVLEP